MIDINGDKLGRKWMGSASENVQPEPGHSHTHNHLIMSQLYLLKHGVPRISRTSVGSGDTVLRQFGTLVRLCAGAARATTPATQRCLLIFTLPIS